MSVKHLDRYANEFSFRWNHKETSDAERAVLAIKGIKGKHLFYKDLSKKSPKRALFMPRLPQIF